MGRLKQIKIGVDVLTEARLTVRAQQAGASLSEYVRGLVLRDLSRAEEREEPAATVPVPARVAELITPQILELSLVTGILVRAQLARAVGEDEARKLETRAQERAAEQLKALLGGPESAPELETESIA
jgi:hypothetical protein